MPWRTVSAQTQHALRRAALPRDDGSQHHYKLFAQHTDGSTKTSVTAEGLHSSHLWTAAAQHVTQVATSPPQKNVSEEDAARQAPFLRAADLERTSGSCKTAQRLTGPCASALQGATDDGMQRDGLQLSAMHPSPTMATGLHYRIAYSYYAHPPRVEVEAHYMGALVAFGSQTALQPGWAKTADCNSGGVAAPVLPAVQASYAGPGQMARRCGSPVRCHHRNVLVGSLHLNPLLCC